MIIKYINIMDFGEKIEERLKKLIEKYGKRTSPLPRNPTPDNNMDDNMDEEYEPNDEVLGSEEELELVDERQFEYHFHYDKRKDETFAFDGDFKIKKEKTSKYELHIIFYDEETATDLREIFDYGNLYSDPAEVPIEYLYHGINDLKIRYKSEKYHKEGIKRILDFVNDLFHEKYNKMENMIKEGIIDFESLWYYLDQVDTIYRINHFDEDLCMRYHHFAFDRDQKGDEVLILMGDMIAPFNNTLNVYKMEYSIKKFGGTKKLDTLKITKVNDKDSDMFKGYGCMVLELWKTIKHMHIKGKQLIKSDHGFVSHERHERVMIDYEGMSKYANNPFEFFIEKTIEENDIREDEKLIIFPFVCVYNLGISKEWGITHVKNLMEIDYRKDAFDHLVLEQEKKILLKSLILNKTKSDRYKDFIDTKGNGLVFLLYGPPGTGKSLTAEATCEFLGKPLYGINVGDLGTDPEHMEEIMNLVLEYSKRWNSIIVIDEVDIFLEERETNMIARNAMVGIFLKLLEYHDGIIFLTTNRLMSLDSAVKSRINLMLSFKELTNDRKLKIWQALCDKWNVKLEPNTIERLSKYKLNGREIRNYVKLVLTVHEAQNIELTDKSFVKELEKCFKITDEFNAMIGTSTMYS